MKKEEKITQCYMRCPFYTVVMQEMSCGHPYFEDKKVLDSMIIHHHNSRDGQIPQECPLRIQSLTIEYSLA